MTVGDRVIAVLGERQTLRTISAIIIKGPEWKKRSGKPFVCYKVRYARGTRWVSEKCLREKNTISVKHEPFYKGEG